MKLNTMAWMVVALNSGATEPQALVERRMGAVKGQTTQLDQLSSAVEAEFGADIAPPMRELGGVASKEALTPPAESEWDRIPDQVLRCRPDLPLEACREGFSFVLRDVGEGANSDSFEGD